MHRAGKTQIPHTSTSAGGDVAHALALRLGQGLRASGDATHARAQSGTKALDFEWGACARCWVKSENDKDILCGLDCAEELQGWFPVRLDRRWSGWISGMGFDEAHCMEYSTRNAEKDGVYIYVQVYLGYFILQGGRKENIYKGYGISLSLEG